MSDEPPQAATPDPAPGRPGSAGAVGRPAHLGGASAATGRACSGSVVLTLLRPGRASSRRCSPTRTSIEVTKATGGVLEPPSAEYSLGTDENGRSVLALLIWGVADLAVRRPAGDR